MKSDPTSEPERTVSSGQCAGLGVVDNMSEGIEFLRTLFVGARVRPLPLAPSPSDGEGEREVRIRRTDDLSPCPLSMPWRGGTGVRQDSSWAGRRVIPGQ